ncbi:MAG: hypothetical protein R3313_05455, partial [Candidatus Saccharimonadales bacterium]|nr:hypothetical protein [Candidatus Saccharimonadales bacterium]
DQLIDELQQLVQFKSGFSVVAEDKSFFGRTPIHLIKPFDGRQELIELHNELLSTLQPKGYQIKNINYVGSSFSPHITVKGDRSIQPDELVEVNSLTLVKSVSEQPKVRQKVVDISFS